MKWRQMKVSLRHETMPHVGASLKQRSITCSPAILQLDGRQRKRWRWVQGQVGQERGVRVKQGVVCRQDSRHGRSGQVEVRSQVRAGQVSGGKKASFPCLQDVTIAGRSIKTSELIIGSLAFLHMCTDKS